MGWRAAGCSQGHIGGGLCSQDYVGWLAWREKFSQVRKFDQENIRGVRELREWKY
jgi:hypothetical protein